MNYTATGRSTSHARPENPGSVYSDEHILVSCCGESRPENKFELLVKSLGPFSTVHDFVTAVHPWLMSLKGDIAEAMEELCGMDVTNSTLFVPMKTLYLLFLKADVQSWAAGVETSWWVALNKRDKRAARLEFLRKQQGEETAT